MKETLMKKMFGLFLICGTFCGLSAASISVLADDSNLVALDVRTPEEFNQSRLIGSINVNFLGENFEKEILEHDKTKTYKVYCRSGNRSGRAVKRMKELGFTDVENLGSIEQAAEKLQRKCEGSHPSC